MQIRFLVSAIDVIHCFTIPTLGIKIDAVPGRINQINVLVQRVGVFFGQCSEICGVNHRFIPIGIEAVDINRFYS
jgi:cytochrome c oxidase subunit 2